jgi:hypothetical protein
MCCCHAIHPLIVCISLFLQQINQSAPRLWLAKVASSTLMTDIEEHNAIFWQYFVQGTSGFLTETINGEPALVNGTPITVDFITFSSKQEHNMIKDRIKRGDFDYGDEIVIQNTSLCQH